MSSSPQTHTPLRLIAEAFDGAPEFVIAMDSRHVVRYANTAAAARIGITPSEVIGRQCFRVFAGRTAPCPGCRALLAYETGEREEREKRDILSDGSDVWLEQRWFPVDDAEVPGSRLIVEVSHEITPVKIAQEQARVSREQAMLLREQRNRMQRLLDLTASMVLNLDVSGRVTLINRHGCEILGVNPGELLGKDWFEAVVPPAERAGRRQFFEQLVAGETAEGEPMLATVLRSDGEQRTVEFRHVTVRDVDGAVTGTLSAGVDVTERRELEAAHATIARMSFYDALTGLPNRSLFLDRVEHALSASKRAGSGLAVVFIDIDDFKSMNDAYGHRQCDSLLIGVAERLSAMVRASDTVSRFGGDEFAVLFEDITCAGEDSHLVGKLLESLESPFSLGGVPVYLTASAGVALAQNGQPDVDELMIQADIAMYRAKYDGRNRFSVYEAAMSAASRTAFELKRELASAIDQGQFVLQYQPQFTIPGGTLIGLEALVRWRHPEHGLLYPSSFLSIAEDSGHIIKLGTWVLRHAIEQAAEWQRRFGPDLTIAVNLSPRQFEHVDLVDTLGVLLEQTGLTPGSLELEITESVAMREARHMRSTFEQLRDLDVRIAIDDFGTGFSSFDQLMRLHVDTIKIDRRFVTDLTVDAKAEAITSAVISLGKNLGLRVVAEGVEVPAQLDYLRDAGCSVIQGFLACKPIDAEAIEGLLEAGGVTL